MQDRKLGVVGGIVRTAQLHPWRTVEHCAIVLLVLHLLSGRACHGSGGALLCASVLTGEGVTPAPQPTMAMADMRPGETVEHHDFRGNIYRFPLGDGIILNLMKTTAGTLRSGDLHNCTQFDVILAGRAKLVTYDTVTKRETAVVYGRNDFIKIPARVPHLFEFLEDNYMVEWWDCDFRAWYYQPYRDRIPRAFEAAKAKDTTSKAAAVAAGTMGKQASEGQKGGDSALQPEEQQGAVSSGEQSRAEAARRQRGEGEAAQQQQQQQQQPAKQAGVEGAAGQSAGAGAAQRVTGGDQGAQEAAGVGVAEGDTDHQRDSGKPQEGSVADHRLGDPVAGASDSDAAAGDDRIINGVAQQGVSKCAGDRAMLPADAEPERKQPWQQQSSQVEPTSAQVGQDSGGENQAAAEVHSSTSQTSGHKDAGVDADGEDLAPDHEDYKDAELQ